MAKREQGRNNLTAYIQKNFRDLELESTVLAFLLREMPMLSSTIKAQWFSSTSHRSIFKVVQFEKVVYTKSSLRRSIKERNGSKLLLSRAEKLMRLNLSRTNMRSIRLQIRQMHDLYVARSALEMSYSLLQRAAKPDSGLSTSALRDEISRVYRITSEKFDEDSKSGEVLEDYEQRYKDILFDQENLSEGEFQAIPTGLNRFDALTGGVFPGEFGVIIGKPSVGKTAAMVSFAVHAWRKGSTILFISGEMLKRDIMHRIDSNISGVPSQLFRKRSLKDKNFKRWDRTIHRYRRRGMPPFEVVGMDRNFTIGAIADEIDRVEEKWSQKVDLVCVDYLNIMQHAGSVGGNREWGTQSDVVWDIKAMCQERRLVCWTASQITDDGIAAKRLSLAHVKYARSIGETAPIVVGLLMDEDDELEGRIRLQILKLRNSPSTGDLIPLNPNLELMRINTESPINDEDENYLDKL